MKNPILQHRKGLFIYLGVWIIFIFADTGFLYYTKQFSLVVSLTESIVSDGLLALLGLVIWFPVYYTDLERQNFFYTLLHHIFSGAIIISVWIGVSNIILISVFSDIEGYNGYVKGTIFWRAGGGFFVYIMLALIYYLLIYLKNYREQQLRESELKALVKESELSSLKSQINPHFLFNSLNSISSLTLTKPEKAQEMIIRLSEFLRYSLAQHKEKLVALKDEIENANRYLDIEKTRFGKKLIVEKDIKEKCNDLLVPGLILQPLLENCIKYGVYEAIDKSIIEIQSECDRHHLTIHIKNDFDPEAIVKKGEGIGLKNIRNRLRIIYGHDNLIEVKQHENIFEVTLNIPQKHEKL